MYKTRIYYQDTDAGGVVYFGNYLRFFERSWFEHLLSSASRCLNGRRQGRS